MKIKYSLFINFFLALILLIISFFYERNSKKLKKQCGVIRCPNYKILMFRYIHYLFFIFGFFYIFIYSTNFYFDILFLIFTFITILLWTLNGDCGLSTYEFNEYKRFGIDSEDFNIDDPKYLQTHYIALNIDNNIFILIFGILMLLNTIVVTNRIMINTYFKILILLVFAFLLIYNLRERISKIFNKKIEL